jgi:hypothetical protein
MIWNLGENTEKHKKIEMHTVGPGIWRETVKNVKNEKYTLLDLKDGKKHRKTCK